MILRRVPDVCLCAIPLWAYGAGGSVLGRDRIRRSEVGAAMPWVEVKLAELGCSSSHGQPAEVEMRQSG